MLQHAIKLFIAAILFVACKQRDNSAQEKMILAGMRSANEMILQTNNTLQDYLESLERDADFTSDMKILLPKLKKIRALSDNLFNYIDNIASQLNEETSPDKVFKSEKAGHTLFLQLYYFKYNLINLLNPEEFLHYRELIIRDKEALFKEMPLLPGIRQISDKITDQSYEQKWIDSSFSNSTALMCQVVLYKIRNDALISTQKMLQNFHRKMQKPLSCGPVLPIVYLSSSRVKAGETIILSTGFGEFYTAVQPAITIDGKTVQSKEPIVHYPIKTGNKPGHYTFPVQFEYTLYDGTRQKVSKNFSYTIVQ